MVTTVCMNPSFDRTACVEKLESGTLHRLKNVRVDGGGKGLNVAAVLQTLGQQVQCVGCLGNVNQEAFLKLLQKSQLIFNYIPLEGEVRTNLKILDLSTKSVTEFNEPGPTMDDAQLEQFLHLLEEQCKSSDYIVLSGRTANGCPEETYQRCLKVLPGKKTIVDTEGNALLMAIREKPYMIKPNLPEIEGIMKKELRTLRSLRDAALFLIDYGVQNVVVSMGKFGAMLVTSGKTLYAPAIPVDTKSTVGAGDAMIGGIVYGLNIGASLEDAFRYGIVAGTASVMTEGTQLITLQNFEHLIPKVSIQEV